MLVYAIDLGGFAAKLGCFDETQVLLRKWSVPTDCTDGGARILPDLTRAVAEDLAARGAAASEVAGIGLGLPGAVKNGVLREVCVNLGGWGGFDAAAELAERTGCPVRAVNDANAAALGEQWRGGARGFGDVVFFTLGTGVGGAVLLGGRLREGQTGSAGEFGHIRVCENEERACGCGGHGCLEQYASARGLLWLARRALGGDAGHNSALRDAALTPQTVFAAAEAGDAAALEAVGAYADALGRGLAAAGCAYDPEVFLVGGGVSGAGDFLLERLRAAYRRSAFPAIRETPIRLASLGNDAGIYGAARLVFEPRVLG